MSHWAGAIVAMARLPTSATASAASHPYRWDAMDLQRGSLGRLISERAWNGGRGRFHHKATKATKPLCAQILRQTGTAETRQYSLRPRAWATMVGLSVLRAL